MANFEKLFEESKGQPIIYNGNVILGIEKISVEKNFIIEIELISTNSRWKQGICIDTKGSLFFNQEIKGEKMVLREELWECSASRCLQLHGESKDGNLWIYNSWYENGCHEYWARNAAMIKEVVGENEYVYHCNDGDWDEDFDDIVFSVKILEGAK